MKALPSGPVKIPKNKGNKEFMMCQHNNWDWATKYFFILEVVSSNVVHKNLISRKSLTKMIP